MSPTRNEINITKCSIVGTPIMIDPSANPTTKLIKSTVNSKKNIWPIGVTSTMELKKVPIHTDVKQMNYKKELVVNKFCFLENTHLLGSTFRMELEKVEFFVSPSIATTRGLFSASFARAVP